MKVISNKTINKNNSQFPLKIECDYCGSELEIEKDDIYHGYAGIAYVKCPCCGEETGVDPNGNFDIKLSINNLKFPDHFYSFYDGVDLSAEEILNYIRRGIEWFRKNPDNFSWSTGTGDTEIHIENYSGDKEYKVFVAKGYYGTEIPYEDEDFAAQDSVSWDWKNSGIRVEYIVDDENEMSE